MGIKRKLLGALVLGGMVLGGSFAFAGTEDVGYNTTVGAFNGSGYSGYQTKTVSGQFGALNSTSVGGSYKVDARMSATTGTGSWARDITDGSKRDLPNEVKAKSNCRVQFSNDYNTPVNVQVVGTWKSN